MGNHLCTGRKYKPNKKGRPMCPKLEIIDRPQTTTPYENGPFKTFINSDDQSRMSENNCISEEYPITPEYQNSYQSQAKLSYSEVNVRSPEDPSSPRKCSIFYPESENMFSSTLPDEYGSPLFYFILKDFLRDNYPINQSIINEMVARHLLSTDDALSILALPNDQSMSELFFSKFVFSEINICKLATFLHVLIKEKSLALDYFNRNEHTAYLLVDHIYYVVNFISLVQNYCKDTEKITDSIYNASLISINCKRDRSSLIPNGGIDDSRKYFIRIHLDDLIFPSVFWSIFSKINETFQCCQELIITSCNLKPEDVYNLVQGLRSSSIVKLLDISTNPITDAGLKHVQTLFQMKNQIESINLTCCSLTHVGVEEFLKVLSQNVSKFHLQSLSLSHNDLDNMSENGVLTFTKLSLSILELQSTNIRCQKSLFESLKLNYSLKHLDVSRNKLYNKDLAYLASGLAYNNRLKKISLSMMGLSKNDCITINNTFLMNKSLVSIDLSDNSIGDEGVIILKDILIMKKSLTEIILKRCNISLHGILVLLRQVAEPDCRLKLLDLCYNRCPRTSIVIESKDLSRKIYDVLHHIELVKKIIILLWGTLDLTLPYYEHIAYPQIN